MISVSNKQKNLVKITVQICIFVFIITACSNQALHNSETEDSGNNTHQKSFQVDKTDLDTAKAYCQAIAEYIKALDKSTALSYDTLYIGNPGLLPKIKLPEIIQGKKIILLSDDLAKTHPEKNKSFILLNICWATFEKNPIEFMFFTFYNDEKQKLPFGYNPQHQAYIYLKYYVTKKEFILQRDVRFEYTMPNKN